MGEGRRTLRTGRSRALPAVARRLRSARFYRANHSPTYSRYFSIALSRSRALKLVRVTPSDNLVHERAIGAQIGEVGVDDTVHSRSDKIETLAQHKPPNLTIVILDLASIVTVSSAGLRPCSAGTNGVANVGFTSAWKLCANSLS